MVGELMELVWIRLEMPFMSGRLVEAESGHALAVIAGALEVVHHVLHRQHPVAIERGGEAGRVVGVGLECAADLVGVLHGLAVLRDRLGNPADAGDVHLGSGAGVADQVNGQEVVVAGGRRAGVAAGDRQGVGRVRRVAVTRQYSCSIWITSPRSKIVASATTNEVAAAASEPPLFMGLERGR